MSAPQLHPDALMEREPDQLTQAERRILDAHLRECLACRLERAARADFEREMARVSNEDARHIIAALLPSALQRPRRPRAARLTGMAAAGLFALVGGLAAAAVLKWPMPSPRPLLVSPQASEPHAEATTVLPPGPAPETVETAAVPEGPPAVASARQEAHEPDGPQASTRAPALHDRELPDPLLRAELDAGATAAPSPASMFDEATQARRSADYARAASLYGALLGAFPASPESQTARAVFGRMELDQGDGARALLLFDEYLQQGGVLAEDVLLGKAIAFERLGQISDATIAWSSLLRWYPDSVHAPRARARLRALARTE